MASYVDYEQNGGAMGKAGRPKIEDNLLKRQLSIFLTNDERSMVKEMADELGVTVSQVIAYLVRQSYQNKTYLKLNENLSQEEREDLESRRERVIFKTQMRSEAAQNRNLSRRMGLDRGLTNVMVVDAPQDFNLPGIFCEHYNNVWIVPYCMLYKLNVDRLINFKCYESVVDFFAGKQVSGLNLSNFIEQHKDYTLTSEGEKSVIRRLAQVYDSLEGLPVESCRPDIPEKDPAVLPYLKDLTVKGEYPYLAFSERQKQLQDALTSALQAIGDVENEIRHDDATVAAQTIVPTRDEHGSFVKRSRGRPRKSEEAKAATSRRRYLRTRAERMLDRVYNLALYNNAPVNLPPEITHVQPPTDELSEAFIETVNELKDYLYHTTAVNRPRRQKELTSDDVKQKLISAKHFEAKLKENIDPFVQLEQWTSQVDLDEAQEALQKQGQDQATRQGLQGQVQGLQEQVPELQGQKPEQDLVNLSSLKEESLVSPLPNLSSEQRMGNSKEKVDRREQKQEAVSQLAQGQVLAPNKPEPSYASSTEQNIFVTLDQLATKFEEEQIPPKSSEQKSD